ncbi:hypothetical protein T492DRAFT_1094179 [Pavlovales sp. CCMP2436]|nr:hypothetical protein T492DRAFT_1094179 [Pavlovales sp. CCMP2436]
MLSGVSSCAVLLLAVIVALHVAAAQPECEVGPSSAYLDGSWEQDASARGGEWYGRPAGHWRREHSFVFAPCSAGRTYYYWTPRACAIPRLSPESACAALAGQQLLFAGDSTMGMQFLSFVGLLDGTFGKQRQKVISVKAVSASACNDTVRIRFIRNDMISWTNSSWDRSLLSPAEAVLRGAGRFLEHTFQTSWEQIHLVNAIASAIAKGLGATFVAIGDQSIQRADASRAADTRRKSGSTSLPLPLEDCVHYCVPGPYDSWSAQIASAFKRGARLSAEAGAPTGEKRWFSIPLADWLGADGWAPGMEQSLFPGFVSSNTPPCSEMLSRSRRPCNPDALSGRWWWPSVQRR